VTSRAGGGEGVGLAGSPGQVPVLSGLAACLEALLFAAGEPVPAERLARAAGVEPAEVRRGLDELASHLAAGGHGVELRQVAGGFQLLTRPEHAAAVEACLQPRRAPLSRGALETLAVVAFRQPITRAAIEDIRGVRCDHALAVLVERGLVAAVGRADGPGRPILYGTTRRFLEHFGLPDLSALPPLEEFLRAAEGDRCSGASPAGPAAD
jgi:segregation and condensation protein B